METRIGTRERTHTRERSHVITRGDYMALDRFIVFICFLFSFFFGWHQFYQNHSFSELTPYPFLFSTPPKQLCHQKYRIWLSYQMMRVIFSQGKKTSHQRYETTGLRKNRSNNHHIRNLAPNWFETWTPKKTKWCWNFETEFSTSKRKWNVDFPLFHIDKVFVDHSLNTELCGTSLCDCGENTAEEREREGGNQWGYLQY